MRRYKTKIKATSAMLGGEITQEQLADMTYDPACKQYCVDDKVKDEINIDNPISLQEIKRHYDAGRILPEDMSVSINSCGPPSIKIFGISVKFFEGKAPLGMIFRELFEISFPGCRIIEELFGISFPGCRIIEEDKKND